MIRPCLTLCKPPRLFRRPNTSGRFARLRSYSRKWDSRRHMELVAREANVAKATLYSYFKNKDELFLQCVREWRACCACRGAGVDEGRCAARRASGRCRHCQAPADIYLGARIDACGPSCFRIPTVWPARSSPTGLEHTRDAGRGDGRRPGAFRRTRSRSRALSIRQRQPRQSQRNGGRDGSRLNAFAVTHLAGVRALARLH